MCSADPAYVLPAMANDPDLMYSKEFVDSARKKGPSVLTYAMESLLMVSAIGGDLVVLYPGVVGR